VTGGVRQTITKGVSFGNGGTDRTFQQNTSKGEGDKEKEEEGWVDGKNKPSFTGQAPHSDRQCCTYRAEKMENRGNPKRVNGFKPVGEDEETILSDDKNNSNYKGCMKDALNVKIGGGPGDFNETPRQSDKGKNHTVQKKGRNTEIQILETKRQVTTNAGEGRKSGRKERKKVTKGVSGRDRYQ